MSSFDNEEEMRIKFEKEAVAGDLREDDITSANRS